MKIRQLLFLPEDRVGAGITSLDVPCADRIYDSWTGEEVAQERLPNQSTPQFNSGSSDGRVLGGFPVKVIA